MTKKIIALLTTAILMICGCMSFPATSETADKDSYIYTIQDVKNLQDFLMNRPAEEELSRKPYDMDGDGRWDVFDLCLMKREVLKQMKHQNNTLVVYFSRTGNTEKVAEYIIKLTNADSYMIEAAVPYTDADITYTDSSCRANKEQSDKTVRPEIAEPIKSINSYDVVYLGYPIWWGEEPRIIDTFLESYDFSDKIVMYFCTTSTYIRSVICYAASKNPDGPFTFVDTLIYSGFTENDSKVTSKDGRKQVNRKYTYTNVDELIASGNVTYNRDWFSNGNFNNQLFPNAIDPTIYYDADGKMYMCYGSWSGGIFTLEIDPSTGKCIHPKSGKTADGRMIDSYFGTKLSGGYHKSGEGPFIEYNPDTGYYYLWVTYGGLVSNGGYNMRVFRSESPTGPFYDPAGRKAIMDTNTNLDSVGLKVMGNYKFSSLDKAYMACGHNSVLRDDDGKWYLFYHARFDDGYEFHEVRTHSMYFNDEDWPVVAPYEYSGDVMAEYGYESSDIAGEYEFINHGNATEGNIINYSNITLDSDGKISGDVAGTWSQAEDSSAAVITIGNQKYNGYFLAAQDENGKKVMSFTAVGNNNQTIWGAQTREFTGKERAGLADYTNSNSELVIAPDTAGDSSKAVKLSNTDLLSGVSYYITNKNSGLSLDLPEGKLDDGTNIQQWDFNKLWAQQWRLIAVDNEYFKIVSMGDESKCVSVASDTAADGTNVELQTYSGKDNQLFKLVKNGSYYGIVSKCSDGKGGLDVFEWSTENGGNINQFAYHAYDCQLWKLDPVHPSVPSGTYTIKNLNSGLYITNNNGNAVQGNSYNWTITKQNNDTYTIQTADGMAFTIENGSAENGTNIKLSEFKNDISQRFTIQCNKDGSYSLMTAVSGGTSCADVFEISTAENANINQWEYWGGDGQKFILEPASDKRIKGDVNADGKFNIADAVLLQKWILNVPDATLVDWKAGDLHEDEKIDAFDMCLMRKLLIQK